MSNKKVIVAMSGGVDSSVAAALLKEQGFDVTGVTLKLGHSIDCAKESKDVAESIGIPHHVIDLGKLFEEKIIRNFCNDYMIGRTPNPCIRCNKYIKFDSLLKKADELGADYIATGHYARVGKSEILNPKSETNPKSQIPNYKLLKGIDQKKDQSYVLYRLGQDVLSRTIFPLGDIKKEEVRRIAKDLKLNVAEKEESQEICFIPDGNYGKFLMDYFPEAIHPGPILDKEGNILGMHGGIVFYTVGQRKGIGAYGERKYVVSIDKEKNALIVGGLDEIFGEELLAEDVSFVCPKSMDGEIEITAKIRYNCPEAEALLKPISDGKWQVNFKKPQKSITPGQSVVFYKGEEVIGGGIICKKT